MCVCGTNSQKLDDQCLLIDFFFSQRSVFSDYVIVV